MGRFDGRIGEGSRFFADFFVPIFTFVLSQGKVIGRFGKPGNGPGELANYGGSFFDKNSQILYMNEANQGKMLGFYLPDAIADSEYSPFVKFDMDFHGPGNAYSTPHYLNDSTVVFSTPHQCN